MKTLQEAFEVMMARMRAQRWVQVRDREGCVYRDERGRRCIVGALMSEEGTKRAFPSAGVDEIEIQKLLGEEGWPTGGTASRFYVEMQRIHDRDGVGVEWKEEEARKMGAKFGLEFPEVCDAE